MNLLSINPAVTLKAPEDGAGILIMKKALTTLTQDGQNLVAMLAQSAPPIFPSYLGNKIDIKV